MKKCKNCEKEFEPKNKKGVFCSKSCKQKNYRTLVADKLNKYNNIISKIDPKAGDMQEANKTLKGAVKESINKKLKFTKVTKKSYEGKKLNRTKFDEASQFKEPISYPERTDHPKYNPKDPREGSAGFYLKYGVMNYDEL